MFVVVTDSALTRSIFLNLPNLNYLFSDGLFSLLAISNFSNSLHLDLRKSLMSDITGSSTFIL